MPKSKTPPSERRLAANRANARKSTGPKTPQGKAKSSLNAVKSGLTGQTVLVPADEVEAYGSHVDAYRQELDPQTPLQEEIVQTLADLQWRLYRLPNLEAGTLALTRRRVAPDLFADEPDPTTRAALLEAHIHDLAAKQLQNLHRQETRLRNEYRKQMQDLEGLRQNQAQRKADKLFHRWYAARKAVLATEEETDYFEQQLADWMTDNYPDGFVLQNGKIVRIEPPAQPPSKEEQV
jgi:hypothetical protein